MELATRLGAGAVVVALILQFWLVHLAGIDMSLTVALAHGVLLSGAWRKYVGGALVTLDPALLAPRSGTSTTDDLVTQGLVETFQPTAVKPATTTSVATAALAALLVLAPSAGGHELHAQFSRRTTGPACSIADCAFHTPASASNRK